MRFSKVTESNKRKKSRNQRKTKRRKLRRHEQSSMDILRLIAPHHDLKTQVDGCDLSLEAVSMLNRKKHKQYRVKLLQRGNVTENGKCVIRDNLQFEIILSSEHVDHDQDDSSESGLSDNEWSLYLSASEDSDVLSDVVDCESDEEMVADPFNTSRTTTCV